MKKQKFTMAEMHDFLEFWVRDDIVDDYCIAHARGYTEICIYLMQSSGALSSHDPIQKQIMNHMVSSCKFKKLIDECFADCMVFKNPDTNETYWKPTKGDLDWFVDDEDIFDMGFTEMHPFKKVV